MSGPAESFEVEPSRLLSGRYDHAGDRTVGEGDIAGSYSADRIGMGQPIRRPFRWRGQLWVCTSISPAGAEAYRLTAPGMFAGTPTTYPEKTRDAESARRDPLGFYHAMTVTHAGRPAVLSGPETRFIAGPDPEPTLFAGLCSDHTRSR